MYQAEPTKKKANLWQEVILLFGFLNNIQDPVCKMKVDKKTEFSSEYKDNKYYFCSENCLEQFKANPEKYIVQKDNIPTKSCCH